MKEWTGAEDFLEQLARSTGKLGKGGEPDLATAAKMLLYDWQRGKLPFFTLPPDYEQRPSANPAAAAEPADAATAGDAEVAAAGEPALSDEGASTPSDEEEDDDAEVCLDITGECPVIRAAAVILGWLCVRCRMQPQSI